ncbi:hypothetical protein BSAE_1763 [Bifidobacterium pullorum subsp. saeculare DSM 6531 = LMG 14934]|uniref:Uncharacterized protein n=1 Tax=Bifidobacterium pullorum subsp. saeculare DSM 6531 = LMG 14934 TaxID=1437611 RepID=A0A087CXX8_9BIFI|nr:hypothetical protein BSAE_1763 [Bifidobacterium pullorum subsp. saeculare DSM 6531 = LMG 14934]
MQHLPFRHPSSVSSPAIESHLPTYSALHLNFRCALIQRIAHVSLQECTPSYDVAIPVK